MPVNIRPCLYGSWFSSRRFLESLWNGVLENWSWRPNWDFWVSFQSQTKSWLKNYFFETSSCLFLLLSISPLLLLLRFCQQKYGRSNSYAANCGVIRHTLQSSNVKSESVDGKRIPLKKIKWLNPNLAIRFGQSASTKSIRGQKL